MSGSTPLHSESTFMHMNPGGPGIRLSNLQIITFRTRVTLGSSTSYGSNMKHPENPTHTKLHPNFTLFLYLISRPSLLYKGNMDVAIFGFLPLVLAVLSPSPCFLIAGPLVEDISHQEVVHSDAFQIKLAHIFALHVCLHLEFSSHNRARTWNNNCETYSHNRTRKAWRRKIGKNM